MKKSKDSCKPNFNAKEIEVLIKAADILENCYEKFAEYDYTISSGVFLDIENFDDIVEEIRNIIEVCTASDYDLEKLH